MKILEARPIYKEAKQQALMGEVRPGVFMYKHEGKNWLNIMGIPVQTWATPEQVEKERAALIWTPETAELMQWMAFCYSNKFMMLDEGRHGLGKSEAAERFAGMILGEEKPIIVPGHGQQVWDLLGHPQPTGVEGPEKERLQEFYARVLAQDSRILALQTEFASRITQIIKAAEGSLTESSDMDNLIQQAIERFNIDFNVMTAKYTSELGKSQLWKFQEGPLLQAFDGGENHEGTILIINEFNALRPEVQNLFLSAVGANSQLAKAMYSYGGSSEKSVHLRGSKTGIILTTNRIESVDRTGDDVDLHIMGAPLTDRAVIYQHDEKSLDKHHSTVTLARGHILKTQETEREAVKEKFRTMSYTPLPFLSEQDKILGGGLLLLMNQIVTDFDREFIETYRASRDKVMTSDGQIIDRTQRFEFQRAASKLQAIYESFQLVNNLETGNIDLLETLRYLFDIFYINAITDPSLRNKMNSILDHIFNEDVSSTTLLDSIKNPRLKDFAESRLVKDTYSKSEALQLFAEIAVQGVKAIDEFEARGLKTTISRMLLFMKEDKVVNFINGILINPLGRDQLLALLKEKFPEYNGDFTDIAELIKNIAADYGGIEQFNESLELEKMKRLHGNIHKLFELLGVDFDSEPQEK